MPWHSSKCDEGVQFKLKMAKSYYFHLELDAFQVKMDTFPNPFSAFQENHNQFVIQETQLEKQPYSGCRQKVAGHTFSTVKFFSIFC